MPKLQGKRVAVLVENGFEQVELTSPVERLKNEGATVDVVSPHENTVRAWDRKEWGKDFHVDTPLSRASADDYDALVLPGGVMNPDKLRLSEQAVSFVRNFARAHKPIAAICHGPWTLIDADAVAGREMTSYPSLRKDLENAGAKWVDRQVVVDHGLVTSRNPDDLDAFNAKMVEEIGEGKHAMAT